MSEMQPIIAEDELEIVTRRNLILTETVPFQAFGPADAHSAAKPTATVPRTATATPFTPSTGPLELPTIEPGNSPTWRPRYVAVLVALDTLALGLGVSIGEFVRFSSLADEARGAPSLIVLVTAAAIWLITLATARTYENRFLGLGSEEFRRVGNAAARFTAFLAVVVFMFKLDIARGMVVGALPATIVLTLAFRYAARRMLHRLRRNGSAGHRVLVVGDPGSRDVLIRHLQSAPHSGLQVVAVCSPAYSTPQGASVEHVRALVESVGADTVAVTHGPAVDPDLLRRLAWSLEGTGVDLLVAPALTDVAGPRLNIRPVSGLPLLQIAAPEFTGVRRLVKRSFDVLGACTALVLASPVLVVVALAVRLSSRGPVLFRQTRVGRGGQPFVMYKFRSMYADAEARLEQLRAFNDQGDGVLFKMRDDPRVTSIGRHLRRFSLDELPQLLNVVRGQMSLVGPRPPLPAEVARYDPHAHRRLLVTPGLTGLWQVSGRSELNWEETVRLDLYYVENWSVALDAEIIWKTMGAVLRGSGAH
jgi:exopolysaccharide biosynthesis polyprenyl glycosylphosphotransferase